MTSVWPAGGSQNQLTTVPLILQRVNICQIDVRGMQQGVLISLENVVFVEARSSSFEGACSGGKGGQRAQDAE